MVRHTPGPWSLFNYAGEGVDYSPGIEAGQPDAGRTTIVMWGDESDEDAGVRGRTAEENLANAKLIAAAPDLLAVAIDAVRRCAGLHADSFETHKCPTCEPTRAAVAKALGFEARATARTA